MCCSRATVCFAFPWTCALFKIPKFPSMLVFKNVVGCDFFFLMLCCFLNCSHIVLGLKCKNFIVRKYINVILCFHCLCQKTLVRWLSICMSEESWGAKIVSNLNLVRKRLTQIFIHLKVNEVREEKWLGRT